MHNSVRLVAGAANSGILIPHFHTLWQPVQLLLCHDYTFGCWSYVLRIGGKVQSWTKFHSWSWWSPSFLGSIGHSHFLGGCCSKLPFGWFESILLKNVGWFNSPIFLIFPRTSLFLVGKYVFFVGNTSIFCFFFGCIWRSAMWQSDFDMYHTGPASVVAVAWKLTWKWGPPSWIALFYTVFMIWHKQTYNTGWCPPVTSLFITHLYIVICVSYTMVIVVMFTNLANYGAPSCRQSMDWLVNNRRSKATWFLRSTRWGPPVASLSKKYH